MEDEPRTPAEFPMKVPLLVTELSIALIRNLAFDTARGFFAPSRSPHSPPRARPGQKTWTCDGRKTIRSVGQRDKAREPKGWNRTSFKISERCQARTEANGRRTAEIHGAGAITEVVTPTSRGYCSSRAGQVADFVILKQQVIWKQWRWRRQRRLSVCDYMRRKK